MAHNYDIISDILYAATVPKYNAGFSILIIYFLFPPAMLTAYYAYKSSKDKWQRLKYFILFFTGSMSIYDGHSTDEEAYTPEENEAFISLIFLLEDAP